MRVRVPVALLAAAALSACTSGNSGLQPPYTSVNVKNTTTLQFAVGTANIEGTAGLNTVVTFRQNSGSAAGSSAVLLDTPSIAGPSGFVVPAAASAGTDAGTNAITGSPQVPPGTTARASTFGTSGGAFGYGFAPENSTTSGAANYPQFSANAAANNELYDDVGTGTGAFANTYMLPLYATASARLPYLGGPPAYPFFNNGTYPAGFLGFAGGFTDFAAAPVTGAYNLTVVVPSSNTATTTLSASATLGSTTLLPTFATPTFTEDGAGGGTVALNVPAGVTETLVYIVDVSATTLAPTFYTLEVTGTGAQTATLTDALGAKSPSGATSPSIAAGDPYFVYAVGFDYPAFEAGNPSSPIPNPTIKGANGQADLTSSDAFAGEYGS